MKPETTYRPQINMLAAAWAIISGFFPAVVHPLNLIITGLIIAIFGFWTCRREWQGYVNGIIGLWLIVSALIPFLVAPANLMLTGTVVMVLAIWRAFAANGRYPSAAG